MANFWAVGPGVERPLLDLPLPPPGILGSEGVGFRVFGLRVQDFQLGFCGFSVWGFRVWVLV